MKVLLDTSAINWLTDNEGLAQEFFAARDSGVFEAIVTPEAAKEVRDTRNPARRVTLEGTLSRFFPLKPTRVPRSGAVRSGLGRAASPEDTDRLAAVGFLGEGQDRNLATNAGGYRCDAFLTGDTEMSIRKRQELEIQLGGTRVLEPDTFMDELRRLARSSDAKAAGSS